MAPLVNVPQCTTPLFTIDTENTSPDAIKAIIAGLTQDAKDDLLRARGRPEGTYAVSLAEVMPRDLIRAQCAFGLLFWSMQFVLFHEIGHLVKGHVDWRRAQLSVSRYAEHEPGVFGELRKEQEWEADNFASRTMLFSILTDGEKVWPEIVRGDRRRAVYLWATAVAVFFSAASIVEGAVSNQPGADYPSPIERLSNAVLATAAIAKVRGMAVDEDDEGFPWLTMRQAWSELDDLLGKVFDGRYSGVFSGQKGATIPMSVVPLKVPHYEEWKEFDRLANVSKGLMVRVQL